jgi:hypothetical protein
MIYYNIRRERGMIFLLNDIFLRIFDYFWMTTGYTPVPRPDLMARKKIPPSSRLSSEKMAGP